MVWRANGPPESSPYPASRAHRPRGLAGGGYRTLARLAALALVHCLQRPSELRIVGPRAECLGRRRCLDCKQAPCPTAPHSQRSSLDSRRPVAKLAPVPCLVSAMTMRTPDASEFDGLLLQGAVDTLLEVRQHRRTTTQDTA
jgi:hypothetical protein